MLDAHRARVSVVADGSNGYYVTFTSGRGGSPKTLRSFAKPSDLTLTSRQSTAAARFAADAFADGARTGIGIAADEASALAQAILLDSMVEELSK